MDGGNLVIGAMTTHFAVANSPEAKKAIPALAALAGDIGDRQVRNMGTLGGSVAHADPSSEIPLALVTLGLFSFRRLSIDLMPQVEIPVMSILTEFPGASPEAVEREVSRKIEEAVNPISGVKHVNSVSREGLSQVTVEFNLEVKINDVSQEARAKINSIRRELPAGMSEPVIQKLDFNATPVVSLAATANARWNAALATRSPAACVSVSQICTIRPRYTTDSTAIASATMNVTPTTCFAFRPTRKAISRPCRPHRCRDRRLSICCAASSR